MAARLVRATLVVAWLASFGASYRTQNFVVDAPTPELAKEIGDAAEQFRRDLALDWLGQEMPQWNQPCMLTAQVAPNLGAGGATSFVFDRGEVFGWRMTIQGSRERILDSVLPHEVTHTIFACHFREALPRWADEGACTTVEHESERLKQQKMLVEFLKTGRGISFSKMFRMKEYPPDVMPLYSQGYSLARFLIGQGGKQKFLEFLQFGMRDENWVGALQQHYGITSMLELQNTWLAWVRQGSPQTEAQQLAVNPSSHGAVGQLTAAVATPTQAAQPAVYQTPVAPQAAPLVPVTSGAANDGWRNRDAAGPQVASIYQRGQSQARAEAEPPQSQYQQMARPQPAQSSQQIILQPQQAPVGATQAPILDAAMLDGQMRR